MDRCIVNIIAASGVGMVVGRLELTLTTQGGQHMQFGCLEKEEDPRFIRSAFISSGLMQSAAHFSSVRSAEIRDQEPTLLQRG